MNIFLDKVDSYSVYDYYMDYPIIFCVAEVSCLLNYSLLRKRILRSNFTITSTQIFFLQGYGEIIAIQLENLCISDAVLWYNLICSKTPMRYVNIFNKLVIYFLLVVVKIILFFLKFRLCHNKKMFSMLTFMRKEMILRGMQLSII